MRRHGYCDERSERRFCWFVRAGCWQRWSPDYYRGPFPDEGKRPDKRGRHFSIAVDQKAQVSFTALRDLYCDAVVTHVSAVSSNGADAGASYDNPGRSIVSYTVDLLISGPDASIKPGMTANVDIMIQHMDNVLTVPLVAVMDDGDGAYVNVVTSRDEGLSAGRSRTGDRKGAKFYDSRHRGRRY